MKLVTFDENGQIHIGVLDNVGTSVLSLTSASGGDPRFASMRALIGSGPGALSDARQLSAEPDVEALYRFDQVVVRAPLPDPVRIRDCCLFIEHIDPVCKAVARGRAASAPDPQAEYARLIATGNFDMPQVYTERVIYYNANHLSISGPDDMVVAPTDTQQLDYELEFAVVIGTTAKDHDEQSAKEAIFGFTIFNDWSCRDIQAIISPGRLGPAEGKDFDGGITLGPCIVTADSIANPYDLELCARVNGEEWSRGNSRNMHHSFEDAIVQLSRSRTIHAGEILASGTVGTGSPIETGKRLKHGDEIELEVEGIGTLRNRISMGSQSHTGSKL